MLLSAKKWAKKAKKLFLKAKAKLADQVILICILNMDENGKSLPAFFDPKKTAFCDVTIRRHTLTATLQTSAEITRNAVCSNSRIHLADPCEDLTDKKSCQKVIRNYRGQDIGSPEVDPDIFYRFDKHCEWVGKKKNAKCEYTSRHASLYGPLPGDGGGVTPPPSVTPVTDSCADIADQAICQASNCDWKRLKKKRFVCQDKPTCDKITKKNACLLRREDCLWTSNKKKGKFCVDVGASGGR